MDHTSAGQNLIVFPRPCRQVR